MADDCPSTPTAPTASRRRWTQAAPTPSATSPFYRPRRPTATPLYPVVQHHLEAFLALAQESDPFGFGVPAWVERDFRAYLRCGIPAHGFARIRCEDCGPERWSVLERTVQRRVLRAFGRRGLLEDAAAADMLTWQASGGFSADGSVRVEGDDRAGVERLVLHLRGLIASVERRMEVRSALAILCLVKYIATWSSTNRERQAAMRHDARAFRAESWS